MLATITEVYGWFGLANGTELNLLGEEFTLADHTAKTVNDWKDLPISDLLRVLADQNSEIETVGVDSGEPEEECVTVVNTADGQVHELYTPEDATKFFAKYLAAL